MKSTSVIWYFDRQVHDTYDKKYMDMKVGTKVAILNRAKDIFYRKIISNRSKNPDFDLWLRPLEVDDYELKSLKNLKEYNLYQFPERFGVATTCRVYASKDKCKANFTATPIMDTSSYDAINNSMWEPSFEFEQTFRTSDANGIKIWHKSNFGVDNAIISYLKTIPDLHSAGLVRNGDGGYVYIDGTKVTKDVDLEIGEGGYDPLINIAVLLVQDNGQDFSLQTNKILNIKQI